MKQTIHTIRESVLDVIFPRHCPVCHEILKNTKWMICPECRKEIRPIREPYCRKCGKPVEESQECCADCSGTKRYFTEGRGIFPYNHTWKKSILKYKYSGCREYGDFYGRMLWIFGKRDIRRWRPDMIVPVPMHPAKLRVRGFNQSEYIGNRLSELSGIPVNCHLIKKTRRTASQKKLNASQRRRNLREAFEVQEQVDGRRILLVDDVFTTGSTMDAMAQALRERGASGIFFLTVCIGEDRDAPV